jgi:hypothetical protein
MVNQVKESEAMTPVEENHEATAAKDSAGVKSPDHGHVTEAPDHQASSSCDMDETLSDITAQEPSCKDTHSEFDDSYIDEPQVKVRQIISSFAA